MVAPLIIAAGIAAAATIGSAIAQWKSSQAGQRATAEERARIEALLEKVNTPNFDFSTITPEEYQFIGDYVPEVAPFVEAQNPQLVEATGAAATQGRDAERQALEQMLELTRSGEDPLAQIERARASRTAAADAQSARQTLDQQFARRGIAPGSGLQYAGNLAAQSDAFQSDALIGEKAAEAAANRRYGAIGDSARLGGDIYERELSVAEKNANTMNNFNKWLRDSRQDWANNAADTRNRAQLRNVQERQRIGDQNTTTRNNYATQERNRQDGLLQSQFDNEMGKVRTSAGLSNDRVGDIRATTQQNNTAIQGLGEGVSKIGLAAANRAPSRSSSAGSQGQASMYSGGFQLGNNDDEDEDQWRNG